jgi:hypothetical protein
MIIARTGNTAAQQHSAGERVPLDRITVTLVPRASQSLQHLQVRTGLSKTDLVNHAISLYDFIDTQQREGMEVIVRNRITKETQILRLL